MASQVPFFRAVISDGMESTGVACSTPGISSMTSSSRGVLLAQNHGAGEVGEAGGVGPLGVGLNHEAELVHDVGLGEVDGLTALVGGGHAGDDEVDGALLHGVDQAVPGELHAHGLLAQGLAHDLGDLDVVAVGEGAVDALDRNGELRLLVGLPVVGGVGRLHAHADDVLVAASGSSVGAGGGVGATAAAGEDHHAAGNADELNETPAGKRADLLHSAIQGNLTFFVCQTRPSAEATRV